MNVAKEKAAVKKVVRAQVLSCQHKLQYVDHDSIVTTKDISSEDIRGVLVAAPAPKPPVLSPHSDTSKGQGSLDGYCLHVLT